jgi:transposase
MARMQMAEQSCAGSCVGIKSPPFSQTCRRAPCVVGLEACCGSHYWVRVLSRCGHRVRLIAPQFVKPYVQSNKNDANDAEAIL